MNQLDESLPELKKGQIFVCEEGCVECKPVEFDFEYRVVTYVDSGEKQKFTHRAFKSSCCGGKLAIWDEDKQDTVPMTP
tara:strand:- start:114 stop:350 length:237 start_codon:yes stop_codon:yes gene_type:complete